MTAAVPAGLHWYQHNKKASLWQWKAPKTHAMSLLFLFNKSNDRCPSVFTITHHLQGSSVCVFSSFCPLIFFPYFLCPMFARCPLLSEDLASSSHHAWVPTSILATKRAEYTKCHSPLMLPDTERCCCEAPSLSKHQEHSGQHHNNGTTHGVWGLQAHDLQQHGSRSGWFYFSGRHSNRWQRPTGQCPSLPCSWSHIASSSTMVLLPELLSAGCMTLCREPTAGMSHVVLGGSEGSSLEGRWVQTCFYSPFQHAACRQLHTSCVLPMTVGTVPDAQAGLYCLDFAPFNPLDMLVHWGMFLA